MNTDQYRTQVANIQKGIAKLQGEKARKVDAAAKSGKKNHDALAAAARASSASTATSKLREATRYASDQAKAETEVGRIEKKIADEHTKLVTAQKRLEDELKRERKRQDTAQAKRVTEEKKVMAEQKRAALQQGRVLRDLSQGFSRHENLHVQTALEIERLKALPGNITVVFFAADPGNDSTTKLGLDEEARLIGERIRASEYRDVLVFHTRLLFELGHSGSAGVNQAFAASGFGPPGGHPQVFGPCGLKRFGCMAGHHCVIESCACSREPL